MPKGWLHYDCKKRCCAKLKSFNLGKNQPALSFFALFLNSSESSVAHKSHKWWCTWTSLLGNFLHGIMEFDMEGLLTSLQFACIQETFQPWDLLETFSNPSKNFSVKFETLFQCIKKIDKKKLRSFPKTSKKFDESLGAFPQTIEEIWWKFESFSPKHYEIWWKCESFSPKQIWNLMKVWELLTKALWNLMIVWELFHKASRNLIKVLRTFPMHEKCFIKFERFYPKWSNSFFMKLIGIWQGLEEDHPKKKKCQH